MSIKRTGAEGYPLHPAAGIFPEMSESEYAALREDIREQGQLDPIDVWRGQVVDGRHRLRACGELNIAPDVREFQGEESDIVPFVVSRNLKRRHLNEGQRAAVADRLATMPKGANQHTEISVPTQSQAAKLLNVSVDSVGFARKVREQGTPELQQAVDSGKVAVSTAADVSALPKEKQREVVARGAKEILKAAKEIRAERSQQRRTERVQKIADVARGNSELRADARYPVVYADPPWRYAVVESESRAIENQYPTMSVEELQALPVPDLLTEDAVLFLWATSPLLPEAIQVMQAWGFTYKTCAVWDKEKLGMGYWFRQQHELLLVGVRGAMPTPAPADRAPSVLRATRGKHSEKPDEMRAIIEAMFPTLPKIELFARGGVEGWDVWGNQAQAVA